MKTKEVCSSLVFIYMNYTLTAPAWLRLLNSKSRIFGVNVMAITMRHMEHMQRLKRLLVKTQNGNIFAILIDAPLYLQNKSCHS